MRPGLFLTERDYNLMLDCYFETKIPLEHIYTKHFPLTKKETVQKRLRQLRQAEYLESFKIDEGIHKEHNINIGIIYQLTRKGVHALSLRYPDKVKRKEPVAKAMADVKHDLWVSKVLAALRIRFPNIRTLNGKLLGRGNLAKDRKLPDGILYSPDDTTKTAVEIEITSKSTPRYQKIIRDYRRKGGFEQILYVSKDKTIQEKVRELVSEKSDNTKQFFFVLLKDLLGSPTGAAITNGLVEFSI